jgi:ribosome assembly protein YihI (activator of Der GTPase)
MQVPPGSATALLTPQRPQEEIMEIPKDQILQLLRDRGDDDKAQQADQELPDKVDTDQHSDLLEKLGIDPSDLLGNIGKKFGL